MRPASQFRSSAERSAKTLMVRKSATIRSACLTEAPSLILHRAQILMDKLDGIGAFADAGRNALDRTVAHVAGGENTGHAGLEEPGSPFERPGFGRRSEERRVGKECRSRGSAYH